MSVNAPTPTAPSPTADVNMTLVWSGVVLVVFVFGGLATPWEVITELIANRGPSEGQASVVAFVAGYTLPLTAATFGLVYAAMAGAFRGVDPRAVAAIVGVVLIVAGIAANAIGLGLLPDYSAVTYHGPPYFAIPAFALEGYFNAYGWALMLSSGAIGSAAALHVAKTVKP